MNSPAEVLQSMITPAVLIAASGTLILSTSNRTARVNERVRELAEAARRETPGAPPATLARQLELLVPRLLLLRSALFALYLAMGAMVAAVFVIGVSHLVAWSGWAAVWMGLAGVGLVFLACVQLVREARLATRSTLEEVEHVRRSLAQ